MGERDVWDLIVNNDDICFKHIIPRLNGTDLKFLYEVNTETRKLIKRSSREKELEGRFKVEEMSSISTLEFAWKNKSLCPSDWSETDFCVRVAKTNKLELLKWAREEKKCQWDRRTINRAVLKGNLEMVKYCIANECPINEWACVYLLPKTVISRYSNTYTKKPKRLGIFFLPIWRLKMVISTYSNILSSVSL
ncbi:unnamed protein product [Bathycoccus prasinos]